MPAIVLKKLTQVKEEVAQVKEEIAQVKEEVMQVKEEIKSAMDKVMKENRLLKSELVLVKEQQLGIQRYISGSRVWVVPRDQIEIMDEIARGSYGAVHKAKYKNQVVAAKCLHEIIISDHTKKIFLREMEMALQCQHPNIVTVFATTQDEHPVILMELMDCSLRNANDSGKVHDNQVTNIFYHIGKALLFLHTRDHPVIHRDVSSANVLLKAFQNDAWIVKLGDLGTARICKEITTANPGAIAYGAPEAADFTMQSPKMDVYSFGVVIVETLTKTLPFQNLGELIAKLKQDYPFYFELVTNCTKHQPNDRPDIQHVVEKLHDEMNAT